MTATLSSANHATTVLQGPEQATSLAGKQEKLSPTIWTLSWSFFFMNVASCIIYAYAPLYMSQILHINKTSVATLEGTVDGMAMIVRSLSGFLSDFVGRRKIFISIGYGIIALARLLIVPTGLCSVTIGARFMEKIGNGVQASARDAFVGDIAPKAALGKYYGLNRMLGMAGSSLGSLIMLFLILSGLAPVENLIWTAAILTFGSSVMLHFVKEKPLQPLAISRAVGLSKQMIRIWKELHQFRPIFWKVIAIISLIKFGYFGGVFLMNRAAQIQGLSFFGHTLFGNQMLANCVFLVVQNVACTLLSYPLGKLSDRVDRRWAVATGCVFMLLSLAIFSFLDIQAIAGYYFYAGIILYGLQMGMQGALMALLVTTMPHHLYGTGFGIFFFVSGLAIIFSNNILMHIPELAASWLDIQGLSASIPFVTIGLCVILALVLLKVWVRKENVR